MWMIALLTFGSSFLLALLFVRGTIAPRQAVNERLAYYARGISPAARLAGRWSGIPIADHFMARMTLARTLDLLLDQADLPIKPFEFVLIIAISALAMGVVGEVLGPADAVAPKMVFVAVMFVIGGLLPVVGTHLRRNLRAQAFTRQLPDGLQALSSSLRAGFSLIQGMDLVATDLPAPISVEFARALREMNLGSTFEQVLQNMGRRVRSPDFDLAVSGILINRQVGGNLSELLDNIVATLRERVRLKAFIRVLTAQHRLSAWIIAAVPMVLLVILFLGMPQYTRYLLVTPIGQVMLVVALCMQVLGGYFIRRIVSIDV